MRWVGGISLFGMKVPLLDLNLQHKRLEKELLNAFQQVLSHGKFIMGPEMELLEKQVASACNARFGIACANGSDALLLVLLALGIGPGDEVITTPYTFFATASCIERVGARAVFVDISLDSYNIDPAEVLKKITPRTKAIIPVHLFGQSAELEPLLAMARERGIKVIEDAAQAIGAEYRGKPVGALADVGSLSFFPTKNLGGMGDGGMLVTNDEALANQLRILRVHGMKPKYYHEVLGVNSRLDTLQAALLLVKLPHLAGWADARARNAAFYSKAFEKAGLTGGSASPLILPAILQSRHVYNQFCVRLLNPKARDPLRKHLETCGVGSEIYYPVPLHLQKCFAAWGYQAGDFPKSELASTSTLALPIFPELEIAQLQHVVDSVVSFQWKEMGN